MGDKIDPTKAFKQFLIDTGITPRVALLLAQAAVMEERALSLATDPPMGMDGKPII